MNNTAQLKYALGLCTLAFFLTAHSSAVRADETTGEKIDSAADKAKVESKKAHRKAKKATRHGKSGAKNAAEDASDAAKNAGDDISHAAKDSKNKVD